MKADLRDFAVCGLVIGSIFAATVGIVGWLIRPLALLHEYHVVVDFFVALLLYGVLSALALRLMLAVRPIEIGEHSMESAAFAYWKILTVVYRLGQGALLPFTPVFAKPLVARLFGARVGSNVALGGTIDDPYLVSIGDGAVLGNHSLVSGDVIANGRITLGRVVVGAGATVGANAIVLPGTTLGDGALLVGGSIVVVGSQIPARETWRGNPARKWV